jgi:hypothetical protein
MKKQPKITYDKIINNIPWWNNLEWPIIAYNKISKNNLKYIITYYCEISWNKK